MDKENLSGHKHGFGLPPAHTSVHVRATVCVRERMCVCECGHNWAKGVRGEWSRVNAGPRQPQFECEYAYAVWAL